MTAPVKTNFGAQEPVVVGAAVVWVLTQVGAIIVGHTGLITDSQWSAVATYLTPIVTAAVLAGVAWVTRRFTVPAAKVAPASEAASYVKAESIAPQYVAEHTSPEDVAASVTLPYGDPV